MVITDSGWVSGPGTGWSHPSRHPLALSLFADAEPDADAAPGFQTRPSGAPHGTPARPFPGGEAFLGPDGDRPSGKRPRRPTTVSRDSIAEGVAVGCHPMHCPQRHIFREVTLRTMQRMARPVGKGALLIFGGAASRFPGRSMGVTIRCGSPTLQNAGPAG